jgi:hypothetical protein
MIKLFRFFRLLMAQSKVDTGVHPMLLMTSMPHIEPGQWIAPGLSGGMESVTIDPQDRSEFARAEERFRKDLPHLLEQSEKLGSWVVYSSQGVVAEGPEEMELYRKYSEQIGTHYFLARVQGDPPEVGEVTSNWFIHVERTCDGSPARGR